MTRDIQAKANALILAVRGALARGVRHYSMDGRLLETEREVLEAFLRDGEVVMENPL